MRKIKKNSFGKVMNEHGKWERKSECACGEKNYNFKWNYNVKMMVYDAKAI